MTIETMLLPTPIAHVSRRLNTCNPDDLAAYFLETSYLVEVFLKTLTIVLHTGLVTPAPDIAYRYAYDLIRGDGLGIWDLVIRKIAAQPIAAYLSHEFIPLVTWISKKRTTPDDEWFKNAIANARSVLDLLGDGEHNVGKVNTVKDLITCLVQIRNKTKAHGAVGADFYADANKPYLDAVMAVLENCPIIEWEWVHLSKRGDGKIRGVSLTGTDPKYVRDVEAASFIVESDGAYFVPSPASRAFFCGDLLRVNRDCTVFLLPNGGVNQSGTAEFIDYGSGKTTREQVPNFLAPPASLPSSETSGLDSFDIQSNVYGNLPELPAGYVKRTKLESELTNRLLDKNHPIITLHGGGGMGKTSLAIAVAHNLASQNPPAFEHVVWFSARDVDLRPTGPSEVQPSVIDLSTISKKFGQLFRDWGAEEDVGALVNALQSPSKVSSKGILFVFDNFETMADVNGLLKFLDQHTHIPNKVLVTSRENTLLSGYPIEVRGMDFNDAKKMLIQSAQALNIEILMTPDVVEKIYTYTGGHAYVMRVIVGEMSKDGRYTPPATVMGRRQDIVVAVFERSFNKLSEAGRNVFLLVANWKSNIPEIGLIVVLGARGIDAIAGIEECKRLSLVHKVASPDSQSFYTVPQLARVFAHKKLIGDPDRLVIQQDLSTLQKFGVVPTIAIADDAESRLIRHFIRHCFEEVDKSLDEFTKNDKLLEALAIAWAPGWRELVQFRLKFGAKREDVEYALRRAVEEEPFSKDVWIDRARYAESIGDEGVRIASLVSAVDADPADVELVKDVASQLSRYINDHIAEIPKARRGVYLAGVREKMERIVTKLDADGLSRLAWLFLLEGNTEKAREYAHKGCLIDPDNTHCVKILGRFSSQTNGAN